MSDDILIRQDGCAGRITLNRPKALNALTWDMCLAIESALDSWADDPAIKLLIIDGVGERAFCSGGDIAEMYASGLRGDFKYGQRFWADEYRMNAKLFEFPKPVVSFLQGFTMGGGVGVGCHGSHRIVCETSQIAMPEVSIGLVPDVGGSLLLARAPGRLGEYLGVTGARMGPGDAIYAGFADYFVAQDHWDDLKAALCNSGDWDAVDQAASPIDPGPLQAAQDSIDATFGGETLQDILNALHTDEDTDTIAKIERNAPLSVCAAIELIHRVRARDDIRVALTQEYRFTARSMEHGDFIEGIRAAIIDRDRAPKWQHASPRDVTLMDISKMLLPLGADELSFEKEAAT